MKEHFTIVIVIATIISLTVVGIFIFVDSQFDSPDQITQRIIEDFEGESKNEKLKVVVKSFSECIKAGLPIMESYPRQCRNNEGQLFVEDIGNELAKTDLIRLEKPRPNNLITSPLSIKGEARGYWFFEADFPIVLLDADGTEVAKGIAIAKDDWMTEEFVSFEAELNFIRPNFGTTGTLILKKDNPSGLPQNDDQLEIPIRFE